MPCGGYTTALAPKGHLLVAGQWLGLRSFDPKTTPHFTADGNTAMARIIGSYYATD